jgi:hypothetical protein
MQQPWVSEMQGSCKNGFVGPHIDAASENWRGSEFKGTPHQLQVKVSKGLSSKKAAK